MRKLRRDVVAVRAHQAGRVDDRVKDAYVEALSDECLRERDVRALAQVVGVRLEAEPHQCDPMGIGGDHAVDDVADRELVRGEHARQQRKVDVVHPSEVQQRPEVLRKAGASERKPGSEVPRRDVEPVVLAEQVHDLARVDVEAAEDPGNLIGERDLRRVEGVAGVLQGFGRADARDAQGLVQEPEQAPQYRDDQCVLGPDDREGRIREVGEPRALAEELGAERDSDTCAAREPELRLEDGLHDRIDAARRHRAAQHHGVEAVRRRKSTRHEPRDVVNGARATDDRSVLPLGDDGVPTHTSETSTRSIASAPLVVGVQEPAAMARATTSSRPGSTTDSCHA